MNVMRITHTVAGLLCCAALAGSALAEERCAVTTGAVAGRIQAAVVDLGIVVEDRPRRIVQLDTPLQVTTDGAPDSFSAEALPERRGVNDICNHVSAYRLDGAGNRTSRLDCPATRAAMAASRDDNWVEPSGIELAWRGGIVSRLETTPDGERLVPCVFSSGPYAGFFGTKTNLTHGLQGDRGECSINDQIDPRLINGLTIQGGRNFLRESGVRLGDLAILTTRRPDGRAESVPAIVVDSGGLRYPAMGTVALNAALLGRAGSFDTREAILGLSIDAPRTVTVTVLPGSFGYRLQRPFTNENVRERLDALLSAAGFASAGDLVSATARCRRTR